MFRTRDFVLVFTAVAFLVMAIGVTVFTQWQNANSTVFALQPTASQSQEFLAVTENSHVFSRAQKLQAMKDKIAASSQLSIIAPEPVEVIEEVQATSSSSSSPILDSGAQLCPGYAASYTNWSPIGIEIEEAEGARLVYREKVVVAPTNTSSTSDPAPAAVQGDILAQLPIRTFPAATTSCIPSDVIGIATDGSLIRNNEAGVYGIFNSSTLVGWALDGFPIYGSAATAGDACGGVMAAEGYRYQISAQRDTILNCFSAAPIRL